jgi:type II secretory pathway pseudopilin PulG
MNPLKPKTYNLKPKVNPSSGFTLIETIIYAALVSLVIGLILLVAFQVVSGSGRLNAKVFLEEEAGFLIRKMEWAIAGASSVNSPSSGTGSNTSFSVDKFEIPTEENPIVFAVSGSDLTIKKGNGTTTILNSSLLKVENATFTHIAATGTTPAGIKIELSVSGADPRDIGTYELTTYSRQ